MTFTDLLTAQRTLEELRTLWIVMDAATAADLTAKQDAYGSAVNRIAPVAGPASDPRFALCADLMTEIGAGGMHYNLFSKLDVLKFSKAQVLTRQELNDLGWFNSNE